jgi:GDPmannose 4,6-dehydratase
MMLEQPSPQDYIIAAGQSHTLTQFVEMAFEFIGKDWRDHVIPDRDLIRPTDILKNKVDHGKAGAHLPWRAMSGMRDVVRMMLESEIKNIQAGQATK